MAFGEGLSDAYLSESKQADLRGVLKAMLVLPTVVVVIRAWSRALMQLSTHSKIPARFWWDDWTAFAGAAFNIALCGIALKLVDLGTGLHIEAVPPKNLLLLLKLLWVEYFIFNTGCMIGRASALFFYTRFLGVVNNWFRHAIWIVHGLNVMWLTIMLFIITFECTPIAKIWEPTRPGRCLNTGAIWIGSGVSSLFLDIIVLIIPIPVLWKLHLNLVRKLQIVGVFICGYLVVVVTIGRLITVTRAGTALYTDPTYKIATPVLWIGSEIAISITSVSLPSLLFLAQRAYREGLWSLTGSHARLLRSRLTRSGAREKENEETARSMSLEHLNKSGGNVSSEGSPYTSIRANPSGNQDNGHQNVIHVRTDFEVA